MKAAGISALVPNQFSSPDGKVSLIGWTLFGITVTALLYNIIQSHQTITSNREKEKKDTADIEFLKNRLREVEHNVRTQMGNAYQTL